MLVVKDLYTNKTRTQPLLSVLNQLQNWSAHNAETNSNVLTPYTIRLGPLSTWSMLNKMDLTKSCRSRKYAIGVDLYKAFGLSPRFVTTNVKRKERKIRQTYIAKKTSRKCMHPLWLVHYMHMPYAGPLQSTCRLWAELAIRSSFGL